MGTDVNRLRIFIFWWSSYIFLNSVYDYPTEVFSWSPILGNLGKIILPLITIFSLVSLVTARLIPFLFLIFFHCIAFLLRAPGPGNHDLVGFLIEFTFLMSTFSFWLKDREIQPQGLFLTLVPVGKSLLLVLYFFAVFQKLNSSYFDWQVSCGSAFTKRSFSLIGIPGESLPQFFLQWTPFVSVLIESVIPFLLCQSRTLKFGVFLGLAFHALLAMIGFWNFSSMILGLYSFFVLQALEHKNDVFMDRLVKLSGSIYGLATLGIILMLFFEPWGSSWISFLGLGLALFSMGSFGVWLFKSRPRKESLGEPAKISASFVSLILVAVGLLPHLGFSSLQSMSMFSGLKTEDGQSNHFLLGTSWQIADNLKQMVTLQDVSPQFIRYFAAFEKKHRSVQSLSGVRAPWIAIENLIHLAKKNQEENIHFSYLKDGKLFEIVNAEKDPQFDLPPNLLERKLFKFRTYTPQDRCSY